MFEVDEKKIAFSMECDLAEILQQDLPWEKLSGANILVTGAGGFVGAYCIRLLMALNRSQKAEPPISVTALVRNLGRAKAKFADYQHQPNFSIKEWDLSKIALPDIQGAEYIIHAASQASPRFYGLDPVGTLLPNSVGTAALLESLTRSGCGKGFLFVSSSEVYGSVSGEAHLTETDYGIVDPTTVRSCYSESKRMGETTCLAWHHQYRLPTYIIRPFHVYGPGLLPEDGRVFSDFVFNILRGENIVMNSDGSARRAFCYISDAIAGLFYVFLKGTPGMAYNIANPSGELSILELAQLLIDLCPENKLEIELAKPNNSNYLASNYNHLIPDVNRLSLLGWIPHISPKVGFQKMIQAYQ